MKRTTRAQALVEFALLLPILLLLSMLLLDLGRAVYYYSVVYNAVREGARYGIIHPTDSAGIEAAVRELTVGLDEDDLAITSTLPTEPHGGDVVIVNANYRFRPVTPVADLFIPSGFIDLHSSSTMYVEK
jgi:Flp pilus assembly protein TadG